MAKSVERVIWAVDPYMKDFKLFKKTGKMIQAWTRGRKVIVEPVVVLSPDQWASPRAGFVELMAKTRNEAKASAKRLLKKYAPAKVLDPTFLVANNFSVRNQAQTLVNYANQVGAEVVFCPTKSKKGMSRVLFGSFAETLVLQSKVPVVPVSPKTKLSKIKRILFCVELNRVHEKALEKVIAVAKAHSARIILFNHIEYWYDIPERSAVPKTTYDALVKVDYLRREKAMKKLAARVLESGVKVETIIGLKSTNIAQSALGAAKKAKADAFAVVSQSGPVFASLVGSTTRNLMRESKLPVWVVRAS